jgi:hypothetical protein
MNKQEFKLQPYKLAKEVTGEWGSDTPPLLLALTPDQRLELKCKFTVHGDYKVLTML